MNESAIVRKIMAAVRKAYPQAYIRKISDRFTRGLPDLLIVVLCADSFDDEFGSVLFVETKTKTGKLSKLQLREALSIRENGGEAIVARDAETVLYKLRSMGAI